MSGSVLASAPSVMTWSLEPLQLAPVAVAGVLYAVRLRRLRRRGTPLPRRRQLAFWAGMALVVLALTSPVDAIGEEELFSAHMFQHVLLGDLAPLCLVVGLTGPMLRPILARRAVERLRVLAHPLVALPLWALDLVVWHVPSLFDAALRHDSVHALEHACFFAFGALMWLAVVETLPGPAWFGTGWKVGYVLVVRLVGTALGTVFIWSGGSFYAAYRSAPRPWDISAAQDQQLAGALMMAEGTVVTLVALAWLFLRLSRESELRQTLLEQGLAARVVDRAVRYGRDLGDAPRERPVGGD